MGSNVFLPFPDILPLYNANDIVRDFILCLYVLDAYVAHIYPPQ